MNVNVEKSGNVIVVEVNETQIGADAADEFRSCVQSALPAEGGQLMIGLSQVDFMDSSGLGVLVSLLKAVRPGGDLVLYGLRPSVSEILSLTHLDAVFTCEDTKEAALARFSADASA